MCCYRIVFLYRLITLRCRDASANDQIVAEMQHHQIRLYPFDADENDDEELALNERIRVS